MIHSLQNSLLVASFKEQGAELCSLRRKDQQLEYIWGGNPDIWGRHAPVLFPIVGRLQDSVYRLNETEYNLPQHGFARDKRWQVLRTEATSIVFRLTSDADTLQHYPFDFELLLAYNLEENKLTTTYQVQNTGKQDLPFSIGAHPAFNCPLLQGENFSDYYLEFEKPEQLQRQLIRHGLRTGQVASLLENQTVLPLTEELFKDDAIVLKGIKSNYILLKSKLNSHTIRVDVKGFPYLGIWTKAGGAPFICIEPWFGITDKATENTGDIKEKEGILQLLPGEQFICSYAITVE